MKNLFPFLLFACITLLLACQQEDNFYEKSDAMLEFSLDTLRFDTVFTELGSATRILKVYNTYNQPIKIGRISVESGNDTRFRFNIDGFASNTVEDIEIAANDSLYIFGEVTVNPDAPLSISPYVIEDFLVFETNGNTQKVLLEAWGQNANYIPNRFSKGTINLLSCEGGEITWDDPKPYVIYGLLLIDDCTLNLPPGTRIYVHGGIVQNEQLGVYNDGYIWVQDNGKIKARGTVQDSIVIQGDRLEEGFAEVSGQWTGVILGKGSTGNIFEYTHIKNSRFGIFADSTSEVTIRNAQFSNFIQSGILAFNANITASNSLVYNSSGNSVQLILGGNYDFKYCTIASYGVDASAIGMSNFFCYNQDCSVNAIQPLNASFTNSIFYGSKKDEVILSDGLEGEQPDLFRYSFTNCIVRVDELIDEPAYADFFENHCNNCKNVEPNEVIFVDANEDNYLLDTLSVAEEMAIPIPRITKDLHDNERDPVMPDIGAFEYQYQ